MPWAMTFFPIGNGNNEIDFNDLRVSVFRYTMRNGNILNLALKNISDVPETCFEEAKEAKVTIVDLCKNKFTKVPQGSVFQCLRNIIIQSISLQVSFAR